ncbi:hypothetical protein BS78_01G388300 [Paspalum vaginatum]|nr:hypothetical protein BS78_01G388300 [Paspalum vaginatum]
MDGITDDKGETLEPRDGITHRTEPGVVLPFNKVVSWGGETGSVLCTADKESPLQTSDQEHRPQKFDADAHVACISTRVAVLGAARQRQWLDGVKTHPLSPWPVRGCLH